MTEPSKLIQFRSLMQIHSRFAGLCLLICLSAFSSQAQDEEVVKIDKELVAQIDPIIDAAMQAYNSGDAEAFSKDYMDGLNQAIQQAFSNLYDKEAYGDYVSRELWEEPTVVSNDAPVALVVYKAKFTGKQEVILSANLINQGGSWKIQQIQFDDPAFKQP